MYEIGGRRIGVRWSQPGVDGELRALSTAAIGIQPAPPNVSVVFGERSGRTRAKHQLHVQGKLAVATASEGRLVRAVVRALGALEAEPPAGALVLDAFVVVDPAGRVIAMDRRLGDDFRRLEARLRRSGHVVIQMPRLVVDAATATALLPDGPKAIGLSVAEFDRRWPREGIEDDLSAGEIELSKLVYNGDPDRESDVAKVADMVPLVRRDDGRVVTDDVANLVRLAERVDLATVPRLDRDQLRMALDFPPRR